MKTATLNAKVRQERGSQKSRQLRDAGKVPAIVYGGAKGGKPNHDVHHVVIEKDALKELLKHHNLLIDLTIDGGEQATTILKEVQWDVFRERVMHVDFERIDVTKALRVKIPVILKGTPKGIAKGGQLRHELHDLEIEAMIKDVPEDIVVRVDDMDLDQVMRVKELKLPTNVKVITDGEQAVAAVRPPVIEAEPVAPAEGAEGAAPAEPEVIGRKKEEGEEGEEGAEGEAAAPAAKAEKKEEKK